MKYTKIEFWPPSGILTKKALGNSFEQLQNEDLSKWYMQMEEQVAVSSSIYKVEGNINIKKNNPKLNKATCLFNLQIKGEGYFES